MILLLPFAYQIGPSWYLNWDKTRREKMAKTIENNLSAENEQ